MKPARPPANGDDGAARRAPVQARSRLRMTRILDEAAVLFADVGFDATTIEAIAASAQTSVGSLYQFFPNKQAVFDALAERYKAQVEALFGLLATHHASGRTGTPWATEVDRAVDAFAAFHRGDAGFRAVWLGGHTSRKIRDEGLAMGRAIAEHTAKLLKPFLVGFPLARRRVIATVIVETAIALMVVAAQQPSAAGGDRIVDEIKSIVKRYLAPQVREALAAQRSGTR
ncbi:MAG: TetR/AcrR family transcriptional regulator [Deltaproteobacteria bacterium]